jgi:ubiquinol-cytochrome c reductase iron-sulfur subunit
MANKTAGRRRIMLAAGAGAVAVGAGVMFSRGCALQSYPRGPALPVSLTGLVEGQLRTIEWHGMPVWILCRSPTQVAALADHEQLLADPQSRDSRQPAACANRHRSLRPAIFVAIGLCTHQGCSPALRGESGFLCPCHASRFDLAGRVFKAGPALANLVIPAHRFENESRLVLGLDD